MSGLAGVSPAPLKGLPGQGGVQVGGGALTMGEIKTVVDELETLTHQRSDLLTVFESSLFESKMKTLMAPTQRLVMQAEVGLSFGWRLDSISGRSALHTGLDFPAAVGTPIFSAAGGLAEAQESHAEYGTLVEIDHGNDLVARYAHVSTGVAQKGDLIKRGQKIAEVGHSGRSTGSHLHFELRVQGIPQEPQEVLVGWTKSCKPAGLSVACHSRQSSVGRRIQDPMSSFSSFAAQS